MICTILSTINARYLTTLLCDEFFEFSIRCNLPRQALKWHFRLITYRRRGLQLAVSVRESGIPKYGHCRPRNSQGQLSWGCTASLPRLQVTESAHRPEEVRDGFQPPPSPDPNYVYSSGSSYLNKIIPIR